MNDKPEEQQNIIPEMSPDEAMANLAFATNLQEQMLQMQGGGQTTPEEGEIGAEMATEGTETPETGNMPPKEETPPTKQKEEENEDDLDSKFEEVKSELKDTIKEEMSGFKKIIADALKE